MQTVLIYNVYAIDLAVIYNVWRLRVASGYWITDIAFLMDEMPLHLKETENPTLKINAKTVFKDPESGVYTLPQRSISVYNLDQINIIRNIFYDQPLWRILPPKALADDEVSIRATHTSIKGKQKLLIEKIDLYGAAKKLYLFDESILPKNPVKFNINIEKIKSLLLHMMNNNYFDEPKLTIEIFRDMIDLFQTIPQPVVLSECISFYTSRHKGPRLKRYKTKGEYTTYGKE